MQHVIVPADAVFLDPAFRVHLVYLKFDAEEAEHRTLDARATWWAGEHGYVCGRDLMRGEERTFNTDRVSSWQIADAPCWLAQAKTVYSDLKQLANLDRYRTARHRTHTCYARPQSLEAAMRYSASTIDELAAMTLVVAHVGGVDGKVTKNEQKAVDEALRVWAQGLGVTPEGLMGERVDEPAFREALYMLASACLDARKATIAGAFAVADASGGIKPEEARALLDIEAAFGLANGPHVVV